MRLSLLQNQSEIKRKDRGWVVALVLSSAVFLVVLAYSLTHDGSNTHVILDSDGNACGFGELKDYKYLIFRKEL